jgi:hypothetical protein
MDDGIMTTPSDEITTISIVQGASSPANGEF